MKKDGRGTESPNPKESAAAQPGDETSPSLLIRIRDAEDSDSWALFRDVYEPLIESFCRRRGYQPSDVDDLCQDVMARVHRSISSFEYDPSKGRFRSWLLTITSNCMRDLERQRRRAETEPIANHVSEICDPGDPEWSEMFTKRIFEVACERIRGSFAETTWKCFWAVWVEDQSANKIADDLQIQVHSVYVKKSRVLKRLEKEVRLLSDDIPILDPMAMRPTDS